MIPGEMAKDRTIEIPFEPEGDTAREDVVLAIRRALEASDPQGDFDFQYDGRYLRIDFRDGLHPFDTPADFAQAFEGALQEIRDLQRGFP
jgi:hypothetical protein